MPRHNSLPSSAFDRTNSADSWPASGHCGFSATVQGDDGHFWNSLESRRLTAWLICR